MTVFLTEIKMVQSRPQVIAWEALYENTFPAVARMVQRGDGDLEDAKDVFHDALLILKEQHAKPGFELQKSQEAYLFGVARHLWLRKQSKQHLPLTETELALGIQESHFPKVEEKRLLAFLENAGKKCLELLRSFYFQEQKIEELVQAQGYANAHSASVQKYKCLEKLRHAVKEQSLSYEDFTE
jgi:RNA polymerase sigma factor (sigma-70 family)